MKGDITYLKGKGFDANPQNINKQGRPRKGISFVNFQLQAEGYSPATKADIEMNFMSLLNIGEERLQEFTNDKEQPMLIRIIGKSLLGGQGFHIVEKMLDRGIGKAKITEEIQHSGSIDLGDYSKFNTKELELLRKELLN